MFGLSADLKQRSFYSAFKQRYDPFITVKNFMRKVNALYLLQYDFLIKNTIDKISDIYIYMYGYISTWI